MIYPENDLDVVSYAVGDYVWTRIVNGRRQLACIQSAHGIRSRHGTRWLVKLRMAKHWTSGATHVLVDKALTPSEIANIRKLGLIPPAGEPLS